MNYSPDPKDEKALRTAYLIAGFIKQTLTLAEHEELNTWVEASDENMQLFEELTDEETLEKGMQQMKGAQGAALYQQLKAQLPFNQEKKRFKLWPYAVAASVLVAVAGIYLVKSFKEQGDKTTIAATSKADIGPGSDKAVLTLANGQKLILENQQSGNLHTDAAATIVKLDSGQIAYRGGNSDSGGAHYNTLNTPRGGQYHVTLSDGTKVWLNAASSLRFPEAFARNERVVELLGEAYLEVAPDKTKPFYVRSKGQEIRVLGTRFNVNAYAEDEAVTTTLLEGSIQLSVSNRKLVMKPGEAATVDLSGGISVNNTADEEMTLAWKNGLFKFRNTTIEKIMKQVSRWYDAQVVYDGKVTKHFNGEIARNLPVSEVLTRLEKTGGVHFGVANKTITVMP